MVADWTCLVYGRLQELCFRVVVLCFRDLTVCLLFCLDVCFVSAMSWDSIAFCWWCVCGVLFVDYVGLVDV